MPQYEYLNEETGETKLVIQSMDQEHVYFEDGKQWSRVFSSPQAAENTRLNPFDAKAYVNKTGSVNKGSFGDLYNRSADMSAQRADKNGGVDEVKLAYAKKYQSERKGRKLPTKNANQIYHDRL